MKFYPLITALLLYGSLHAHALSNIKQTHDHTIQVPIQTNDTSSNTSSSSLAKKAIRTSYWYPEVSIVFPAIGGGYRGFVNDRLALDLSISIGPRLIGIPAIELRLLALMYGQSNLYFGIGIGATPFAILLGEELYHTIWVHHANADLGITVYTFLAFSRFAIGYEWVNKKNKRRFIQLTGLFPRLSFGLEF